MRALVDPAPPGAEPHRAPRADTAPRGDRRGLTGVLELLAVALLALVPRLGALGHAPHTDELLHILAAQSLLENGTLELHDGGEPYTRARLMTYLTAGAFRLFGQSLEAARLVPLLAGVLLVVVFFAWLRAEAGRLGAWLAAVLLALDPRLIEWSQFVRFYTLQPLLVWLGAFGLHHALLGRVPRRRALAAAGAAVAFALALHLQVLTAIAMVGIAVWAAGAAAPVAWRHPRRWVILGTLGVLAVVGLVGAWLTGMLREFAALYAFAPPWADADRHNVRFYVWSLSGLYPAFFALLPLLGAFAVARFPRPASLLACVTGVGLVLLSFAAWKVMRYFSTPHPAFLSLVALGFAAVLPPLHASLATHLARLGGGRLSSRGASRAAGAVLALGVAFLVVFSPAASAARRLARGAPGDYVGPYQNYARWPEATPTLRDAARDVDVVYATTKTSALYYLGDLDGVVLAPEHPHREGADDVDAQVGLPRISTPGAMERLLEEHPSGLVIVDHDYWREPFGVSDTLATILRQRADSLPLPAEWRIYAFRWGAAPGSAPPSATSAP